MTTPRLFAIALAVQGCSSSEPGAPPCDEKAVHGVRVSTRGEPAIVCAGAVLEVHADRYLCATHTDATAEMTWSSEAPAVATVEGGRVTGVSQGQATIAAALGADRDALVVQVIECPDAGSDTGSDALDADAADATSPDDTSTPDGGG